MSEMEMQLIELANSNEHRDEKRGRIVRSGNIRGRYRMSSPEIRSLHEGIIPIGSVAPLLSRRAKALALKIYCGDVSKNEENDMYEEINENEFSDNNNRQFGTGQIISSMSQRHEEEEEEEEYEEERDDDDDSSSISLLKLNDARRKSSPPQSFSKISPSKRRKISKKTKTDANHKGAMCKKRNARKAGGHKKRQAKVPKTQIGPMTRSRRRAAMVDQIGY